MRMKFPVTLKKIQTPIIKNRFNTDAKKNCQNLEQINAYSAPNQLVE